MKNNELAVQIAKDVIKQLNEKKIVGKQGSYVSFLCETESLNNSFQDQLRKDGFSCSVCALGGMIVSWIGLYNKYTVQQTFYMSRDEIVSVVSGAFSEEELMLIECVFEGWYDEERIYERFGIACPYDEDTLDQIQEFHYLFDDSSERLEAIMENIIEGDGAFELP